MAKMKYCPNCKQMVATERGYNAVVLIILLIIGILPGLIYWAVKRGRRCPLCHTPAKNMTDTVPTPVLQQQAPQYPQPPMNQ
jgi:hypothetical protein